jgi:hypothetical protein
MQVMDTYRFADQLRRCSLQKQSDTLTLLVASKEGDRELTLHAPRARELVGRMIYACGYMSVSSHCTHQTRES